MTELGRSDWSEALSDHFDLRQRIPLQLAGDVIPVVLLGDLTEHPHQPFITWSASIEVPAGGAGTIAQAGILLDASANPQSRLVVDAIIVQSFAAQDIALGWEKAGNVRSTLGTEFVVRDAISDDSARAPTPIRWRRGAVAAALLNEGFRLWFSGFAAGADTQEVPCPFTVRVGTALLFETRALNTGFRVNLRGRLYG